MKKLIVLRGTQATGKTSSIKMAFEMIRSHFECEICQKNRWNSDFAVLISVGSAKIGMVSTSEYVKDVRKNLQEFAERGCQLIVCATKTYGGAAEAVTTVSQQHKYEIERIEMERGLSDKQQQKQKNKEKAEAILSVVRNLVDDGAGKVTQ